MWQIFLLCTLGMFAVLGDFGFPPLRTACIQTHLPCLGMNSMGTTHNQRCLSRWQRCLVCKECSFAAGWGYSGASLVHNLCICSLHISAQTCKGCILGCLGEKTYNQGKEYNMTVQVTLACNSQNIQCKQWRLLHQSKTQAHTVRIVFDLCCCLHSQACK